MKKVLAIIISLAMVIAGNLVPVLAEGVSLGDDYVIIDEESGVFQVGDVVYKRISNNEAGVMYAVDNTSHSYEIPEIIRYKNEELKVTVILNGKRTGTGGARGAFANMIVNKLTLPTTLNYIGDYAFWRMKGELHKIVIPEGVVGFGCDVFTYANINTLFLPSTIKSFCAAGTSGGTYRSYGDRAFGIKNAYYNGTKAMWNEIDEAKGDYHGIKEIPNIYFLQSHEESLSTVSIAGKTRHYYGQNFEEDDENKKQLDRYIENYKAAYRKYIDKVSEKVKELDKSESANGDLAFEKQAEVLQKSKNFMLNNLSSNTNETAERAAYEALARAVAEVGGKAGIDFSNVDFKNVDADVTNKVDKYIRQNSVNSTYNLSAKIDGESLRASVNLMFDTGTIVIERKRNGTKYRYSCVPQVGFFTKSVVNNYLDALKDLQEGAIRNVKYAMLSDFLGTEIGCAIERDIRRAFVSNVNKKLESVGIKNLANNIVKCFNYQKNVLGISRSLTNFNSNSMSKVLGYLLSEDDGGSFSTELYKKLCKAQKKVFDKIDEYILTGKITDDRNAVQKAWDGFIALFNCPVAISIFDQNDTEVAHIGPDDTWAADGIEVEEIGDTKIAYLPRTGSYRSEIAGTDDGRVTCVYEAYSDGMPDGRAVYPDIEIQKGSNLTAEINANGADDSVEVTMNEGSRTIKGQYVDADEDAAVDIRINKTEGGIVSGQGKYVPGEKATLSAEPLEGYVFDGWFDEHGDLIDVAYNYDLIVNKGRTISAKFRKQLTEDEFGEVEDLVTKIESISEKTITEKDRVTVEEIRKMYDSLSTEQKALLLPAAIKTIEAAETKIRNNNTKKQKSNGVHATKIIKVGKCKIDKLVAGKKSINVTWRKVKKANKYQIRYSLEKKFKKGVKYKVTKYKNKGLIIKKLKSRKKYYVQIRALLKVKGKSYYGQWSKGKNVKTK